MKFHRIMDGRKVKYYLSCWEQVVSGKENKSVFFQVKVRNYFEVGWKIDFFISSDMATYRRFLILDASTYSEALLAAQDGKAFAGRMLRQGKLKC